MAESSVNQQPHKLQVPSNSIQKLKSQHGTYTAKKQNTRDFILNFTTGLTEFSTK